jgi:glycosyltransferase involved in cell wall biosynthesis
VFCLASHVTQFFCPFIEKNKKLNIMLIDFIIPSFNEEKYISGCISSITKSCRFAGLSDHEYRLVLVDGGSTDSTIEIVRQKNAKNISIIHNERRFLAAAWNIGLDNSEAKYVLAMNAHAELSENYVTQCLEYFKTNGRDKICAVGGALENSSLSNDPSYLAVAKIMGSRFGVGNSAFRTEKSLAAAKYVDTLHCPMFLRKVIGSRRFDERLVRSQDYKFNQELIRDGYRLVLLPKIRARYYVGRKLSQLPTYALQNGYWVTFPIKYGLNPSVRHLIPLAFVCYIVSSLFLMFFNFFFFVPLIIYFLLNVVNSLLLIDKLKELPFLMASFFTYHFFYGLGSFVGLIDMIKIRREARL